MKSVGMAVLLCALIPLSLKAQHGERKKKCDSCNDHLKAKAGQFKKGEFFVSWGYNRAAFSRSNISFQGPGVDFTLHNVVAKDRPTPFNFNDYFVNVTVPQFVGSGGYFFKDNWSISFGTDHMKYVMVRDQEATISGTIDSSATEIYNGNFSQSPITVKSEFLRYEHTNGLNYIHSTLEHYSLLWDAKKGPFKLSFVQGFSLALLYPRSDVDLFNVEGTNVFHVAGWGTGIHGGLRFNIFKNFFAFWNNKAGFIALPDVLCEINKYKAQQHFFYFQSAFSLGYNWRF